MPRTVGSTIDSVEEVNMSKVVAFSGRSKRIPPKIAYPSDYGLTLAAVSLIHEYGRDGAVNRLIEMAEHIASGFAPADIMLGRRRVEPR